MSRVDETRVEGVGRATASRPLFARQGEHEDVASASKPPRLPAETGNDVQRSLLALRPVLLAFALCLPAAWPLLQPGFVATRAGGDSPFLLVRLHELLAGLAYGFPVRWMPTAAYGLGYPFWNFYAPLPYYLAALFDTLGLGPVIALKLTHLLGFVVAALGMYALGRSLWRSEAAGWLAAAAYTYAPFHLVNVYVRGDSLGEFWAFAFYPLTWLAARAVARHPAPARVAALALAYGGLVLSHNISALIFSPFLLLYMLSVGADRATGGRQPRSADFSRQPAAGAGPLRSADFSRQAAGGQGGRGAGEQEAEGNRPLSIVHRWWRSALSTRHTALLISLVLGLAVSAWFWAPALAERSAVQVEGNLTGFFSYTGHFRGLNLVQLTPLFDYDPLNGAAFVVGLAQALAIALGALVILVRRPGPRWQSITVLVTLLGAAFCITPLSRPLWDALPLLAFAQFPWRFLSIGAFAGALSIGALATPRLNTQRPVVGWAVAVVGLALAFAALARLDVARIPVADAEVTAERIGFYEVFTANIGTTIRAEYLPRQVDPRPYITHPLLDPTTPPLAVTADGATAAEGENRWRVTVDGAETEVALPRLAFPGWQARLDGTPTPVGVAPGTGYLTVRTPPGDHTVELVLGRTPVRTLAEGISLLALLALAALLARDRRWLRYVLPAALVGLAAWGLGLVLPRSPAVGSDPHLVVADFIRVPWLHGAPNGVRYTSGAHLTRAETRSAAQAVVPVPLRDGPQAEDARSQLAYAVRVGDALTVTLTWANSVDGAVDVALVSPAENIFSVSYQVANERQRLAPTTTHRLEIPADTTPGLYWLRLRVQDSSGGEASPLDDDGRTLGRLYLQPVYVYPSDSPPLPFTSDPTLKPLADMTGGISLLDVTWEQPSRRTLQVALTWGARRALADNYVTSIRVLDLSGNRVAGVDQAPGYGFLPTTAWPPGQRVYDRRRVELPGGLAAGTYRLEIILYERVTQAELGRALVDGVRLQAVPP